MKDPSRKALVPRKPTGMRQGGRVPTGTLVPGSRPASAGAARDDRPHAVARATPERVDEQAQDLVTLVSAGSGFYDSASVADRLGLPEDELAFRARLGLLLGLPVGDGSTVYPAWQFNAEYRVISFLTDILSALAAGITDPWTWALWLTAPRDDGQTAIDVLRSGGDPRPVLEDAQRDAGQWRS